MKQYLLSTSVFMAILLLSSCRKGNVTPGPDNARGLSVALINTYLPVAKVDSAFAVWKLNGKEELVKLNISHDSLLSDPKAFTAGKGMLTIRLFSNMALQGYKTEWVYEKEVTQGEAKSISVSGPASFLDANWSPRVILIDGVGHYAIVGLRPEDAYFYVKDVQPVVTKLVVGKYFWKTTQGMSVVAGREWECESNCTDEKGNVENNSYFAPLAQQIGNRAWNHIEINILFRDNPNGGYVMSVNHTIDK